MELFQFNINHKTIFIFITSIVWAINFRSTFKNIDSHMDTGSYSSLKYDHNLIIIKNIFNCFFFVGFFIETKLIRSSRKDEKQLVKRQKGNTIIVELKENDSNDSLLDSVSKIHQLNNAKLKILFWSKIIFIIAIIYFMEELYFIFSNNHILDRIVCPIRNLGFLISILIFSPLLVRKSCFVYRHQLFPLIIIFILSITMIVFNITKIERFDKIFGLNFVIYFLSFTLMGLESVLIKYLVDIQYINIFLILGIKGIVGTLTFGIINIKYSKIEFFNFFDNFLDFEYDDMYMEFPIYQKIIYIASLLVLQYLIIYTISLFTPNHLLSALMIADILYFPLYIIERFAIQGFNISNPASFCLNVILGFINVVLMLIFNEILEVKMFGLNSNLEKNINKRQEIDYLESLEDDIASGRDSNELLDDN